MNKRRKLEKLVLATILAGSMVVGHSAFAAEETRIYDFGGKPFMKATINRPNADEDGKDFRSFYPGEDKAISNSLNYWYDVLGTPQNVPNIDIFLKEIPDSGASGGSEVEDDATRLAKCFQEGSKLVPGKADASITVDVPAGTKKWDFGNLSILPRNGYNNNYQATFVHEIFHALGVTTSFRADFDKETDIIEIDHSDVNFLRYEKSLHDILGNKLKDSNYLAIVESPKDAKDDKTFYFIKDKNAAGDEFSFNGLYFKGKHVDEVLNLNGQQVMLAWPDDADMPAVKGIPINGIEYTGEGKPIDIDISHFELQNSMQSHQSYRNWGVPMEVELAALEDLGYTIDRRKLYGNSVYNSGIEYVNNNPFYERKDGKYIEGVPSTQSLAIGLHIYGSNNKILQKSNLLADGAESMGIRVDGVNNKLTIDKDSKVTANGLNGRGVNFAYGKNHELNVEGTVTALGEGGKALAFDFGDNMLSNGKEYRGSYIRAFVDEDGDVSCYTDLLPALNGPLAKNVNISGTVAGKEAAIYISPNAYVENINIKNGAMLKGDIISDWSPTGDFPDIMGEGITIETGAIQLPKGEDGLTRLNFEADNLTYTGNIGASNFSTSSIIMNINSGTLNYEGEAKVDSVNVAEGAILQGGSFVLDTNKFHIREDVEANSGTLTNKGMISAALPNGKDTVLSIKGDVVNDGGSMAFIANGDNVGTIEITGDLSGNKTIAVNPSGCYLPGDSYQVSGLVTVNDSPVYFEEAVPYKTGMLKAVYGDDYGKEYSSISFEAENNLNSKDSDVNAAFEEMNNLAQVVSAKDRENLGKLYSFDSNKATKALKSIKGREAANTGVVMQQSNLVRNALGMRLSHVNRAKSAKVVVPVKQLTKGEAIVVPMDITVQPEYDMWAKVSRNKGAINTASDYKTDAYSIGWDKQVNKDWRFGFFGSFAKGKFEADTIYNKLEDYRLGAYGGYNKGATEAMVYADYGWGKNKLQRELRNLDLSTSSKYDSNVMEIGAEYKYDLQHDKQKAWHVAPYGAMQLNRYSQKAYAESGAEPFNKHVASQNNTYAGVEAGVDLERRFANGSAYGMRLGYRRGLTGVDPKQSYHYAADPEHRYTNYGESDKNKLVFKLNGEVETASNWSVSGEVGYERGKKGHGYSGEVSLKYNW